MNRFFSTAILICTVSAVMAMPVRRGQWKTVTLADGSTVSVEARGDETMHYWQSADGRCYVRDSHTDRYREVALETLKRNAAAPATRASRTRKMRAQALRRNATQSNRLNGQKRGIVILVDFKGKGFSMANPSNYYSKLFNTKDYYEYGFNGSVHDYFYAQSHGKFDISFDVVGPVTMPHYFAYYGRNDEEKVGEMIHDACVAVDDEVDFSKYDWDGDGEVDMVYVVYAGYGQADYSENDNYIWPHMYILSGYSYYENTLLRLDNTVVDVYACSNEMDYTQNLNGIGTVCHEFSHCLGLPDMYDTAANTNFGMGSWDLMDYGCNNDNGRTPSGYTGYEKMVLGWSTPIELTDPVTVTAMQPASQMGRSYVVYNPARKTEFYVLDNRQPVGFDEALPGHGMLITHVDYDEKIWDNNIVNATGKDPSSGLTNSHQRATIYHADNDDDIKTESSDPYPYHGNDSLTGSSRPAAKWYNVGSDGETRPGFGIFDIKENDDGTMSFNFRAANVPGPGSEVSPTGDDEVLLRETFDRCQGSGGNDGKFKGNIAQVPIQTDLDGWDYIKAYGGDRCARFGKATAGTGVVSSPWFSLPGDTLTLTFKAAGWDAQADGTNLLLSLKGGGAKFVESGSSDFSLTMTKGAWTEYKLKIVGSGSAYITFAPSNRFFLDEMMVVRPVVSGISTVKIDAPHTRVRHGVYSLDGRYLGSNPNALPRGIYIVNGRKYVK